MKLWHWSFCPSEIISEPPLEFLSKLAKDSPKDAALIVNHLDAICELKIAFWPSVGEKQISKNHYQLTVGNHRVYFGIYGKELVVFYICRKKGRKAELEDLNRARLNQEAYNRMCQEGG